MKKRTKMWLANNPTLPQKLKDGLIKHFEGQPDIDECCSCGEKEK